ncbi:alpha/beta fold hydrolase [Halovenus sp. WSH3]|uniref:Alpha/beta fold hydrolase n=1 Tax=Halovenus carboxidivorans TaxID=2692199 RepID=A0A6B0TDY8_9EURY|nr:alpha/beta fold hydrolase [Halovenus carboxidivorans]MXR53150.1 alpha/beta fold hydrolase [Halovenus carboxidivorans]
MVAFPIATTVRVAQSVVDETYSELAPFQPDRSRRRLEREYADEHSRFVDVGGTEIHYRIEGPEGAPTLLLVHGTYSSLHTWDGWVGELSDSYQLVRLDMPGFGLTGPRVGGPNRLEGLVEMVGTFCDELGLSEVAVAGNSLGGAVAWRLSVDRPDLVSRLVLLDAGGATLLSILGRKYTPLGSEFIPRYLTPRSALRLILKDAYADPSKVTPALVRRYHDLLLRSGNRGAVIEIARNYQRDHDDSYDSRERLSVRPPALPSDPDVHPNVQDDYDIADVSAPTLFQWGAEDEWLPMSFGRELADQTPDSVFQAYEGVGHIPMEETPTQTAADAAAFLRATRSA